MPSVSVIIPARNEAAFIAELLARVRATGLASEIVVVDDGSEDGTAEIARKSAGEEGPVVTKILIHAEGRGKGAALRTGFAAASGEILLVQDADLEYDPRDYATLLAPFADPAVKVVYGSRNLGGQNPRSSFAFYWGGRFLSLAMNLLHGARLTDEATGYKVFRRELVLGLGLREDGFEFCPEVTAKLLRKGETIVEVPIRYSPRSRTEGKKIQWHHGLRALWVMLRIRLGSLWRSTSHRMR